uniref:Uncharacterized protein n=1 Tax=Anguilla anguilla TaxID=7936 RepID=A0A0E9S7R9_ANGAN
MFTDMESQNQLQDTWEQVKTMFRKKLLNTQCTRSVFLKDSSD